MSQRKSIDAWIDLFFRRRSAMANGASTMGSQLERLSRMSCDSDGNRFGPRNLAAIPCSDDSAAFNAAHSTDRRLADHAADLLIWASLTEEERSALERQRMPVVCAGGGRRAVSKRVDKAKVLLCPSCGLREDLADDGATVKPHVRRVRIERERRLSDVRHGDGVELIRQVGRDGWWLTAIYEPVQPRLEDIAESMGLSERQVRRIVGGARKKIAEKLADSIEEEVADG